MCRWQIQLAAPCSSPTAQTPCLYIFAGSLGGPSQEQSTGSRLQTRAVPHYGHGRHLCAVLFCALWLPPRWVTPKVLQRLCACQCWLSLAKHGSHHQGETSLQSTCKGCLGTWVLNGLLLCWVSVGFCVPNTILMLSALLRCLHLLQRMDKCLKWGHNEVVRPPGTSQENTVTAQASSVQEPGSFPAMLLLLMEKQEMQTSQDLMFSFCIYISWNYKVKDKCGLFLTLSFFKMYIPDNRCCVCLLILYVNICICIYLYWLRFLFRYVIDVF